MLSYNLRVIFVIRLSVDNCKSCNYMMFTTKAIKYLLNVCNEAVGGNILTIIILQTL